MVFVEACKVRNLADELEKMRKSFNQEKLLKAQAVNKLAEIMNRKDMGNAGLVNGKNKISSTELKRKEKECRKLQQELTQVSVFTRAAAKLNRHVIVQT